MNIISNQYWIGSGIFSDYGLDCLQSRFQWPKNDLNSYNKTVELKHRLQIQWQQSSKQEKLNIATEVIKDWGGIKGNKQTTIEKYTDIDIHSSQFPFKGVASYSKVLGIVDPLKFAILDARVIVSLNAIQLLSNTDSGVYFPYLSGRNKITGDNTNKRGFSQIEIFKRNSPIFNNWIKPKRDDVYQIYLNALKTEARKLNEPLYKLEMALFADAEKLALQCAEKFNVHLT